MATAILFLKGWLSLTLLGLLYAIPSFYNFLSREDRNLPDRVYFRMMTFPQRMSYVLVGALIASAALTFFPSLVCAVLYALWAA